MLKSELWPLGNKVTVEDITSEFHEDSSSVFKKQLGDMEGEVQEIQLELATIKKNRLELMKKKNKLGPDDEVIITHFTKQSIPNEYKSVIDEGNSERMDELAKLREELIRTKNFADEEKYRRQIYERKLVDLEHKLNGICSAGVSCDKVSSNQSSRLLEYKKYSDEDKERDALKSQVKDLKSDMEDLKLTISEKDEELQDYRLKYLQAQQQVEELKGQLDVIEYDNKQVSEQIQIEIQKMKMQFQEKLQELAPLPDLLKGAQIQLQEAKQLQKLAEDNSEQLSNELQRVKEKLVLAVSTINHEKGEKINLWDEKKGLKSELEEKNCEVEELRTTINDFKDKVVRLEEKLFQEESRYREKAAECLQYQKDLQELKIESSKSLLRSKDRSDLMRKYMQTQISELERQLIHSRAQTIAFKKERDEIRQRVLLQINGLQENFEMVEMRLKAVLNQLNSLKNSYAMILTADDGTSLNVST